MYRRVKAYLNNMLTVANPARFYFTAVAEALVTVLLPHASEHMVRDNKKTLMPTHVVSAVQSCTELQQVFSTLSKENYTKSGRDLVLPEDADIDLTGFTVRPARGEKAAESSDEEEKPAPKKGKKPAKAEPEKPAARGGKNKKK